jgi:hypothetical protein
MDAWMHGWIGKERQFLDWDLLLIGFLNLQSQPLPSTLHILEQHLRKQRATANNYFCPSTTKRDETAVTTPEVNQGWKCKNVGSAAE